MLTEIEELKNYCVRLINLIYTFFSSSFCCGSNIYLFYKTSDITKTYKSGNIVELLCYDEVTQRDYQNRKKNKIE